MHRTLLLLSCLFCSYLSFSQSLEGQWDGWYNQENSHDTAILKLQFQLNKDSTYDVYSFTRFKSFKSVCKMSYKMLNSRTIYLEETEVIRSTSIPPTENSFQKMTLQITNGFRTMRGKWLPADSAFEGGGEVYLLRK